jgi:lysozyme family protein
MSFSITALESANAARWEKMTVHANHVHEFDEVAKKLFGFKAALLPIATRCNVPWFLVAVIDEREGGGSLNCDLGNGQSLKHPTTEVPRHRGPFKSFSDGCYDALVKCTPYASKWGNWTVGGALKLLEAYNGYGYAERGRPSPYVWAGTDQYVIGKFDSDGHYSASTVDTQLGCAALLKRMMVLDQTIQFAATRGAMPEGTVPPEAERAPVKATGNVPSFAADLRALESEVPDDLKADFDKLATAAEGSENLATSGSE